MARLSSDGWKRLVMMSGGGFLQLDSFFISAQSCRLD